MTILKVAQTMKLESWASARMRSGILLTSNTPSVCQRSIKTCTPKVEAHGTLAFARAYRPIAHLGSVRAKTHFY